MTPAEAGLMQAISAHLSPTWGHRDTYPDAYHYACVDVQVAIAALHARHWDPAANWLGALRDVLEEVRAAFTGGGQP